MPSSTAQVLRTLELIRNVGSRAVPLERGTKRPIIRNYTDPNYETNWKLWRDEDLNVGILTGPGSSGPVDVDLDCAPAAHFARYFLPETSWIFGRKSRPASHYMYRMSPVDFSRKVFSDFRDKSVIVEIRGDRHQTMMPGSIHDSKEEVEWTNDWPTAEPPMIAEAVLLAAARKIAAATLIVRHAYAEGQRNEIILRLAGMFWWWEWPEQDALDFTAAILAWDEDSDPTRLRTVSDTYSKAARGQHIMAGPSLTEFLGDSGLLVNALNSLFSSAEMMAVEEYNEKWALINMSGKPRIVLTDKDLIMDTRTLSAFGVDGFHEWCSNDWLSHGSKRLQKSKLWMRSPRRRSYNGLAFLPGKTQEEAHPLFNIYFGWASTPDENRDIKLWNVLVKDIICNKNPDYYNWVMAYLADMVQRPMRKPGTALVLHGAQGVGKNSFAEVIMDAIGHYYCLMVTNSHQLTGRFNAHLENVLFLFANEAFYAKDPSGFPILKSLITDEDITIEAKGLTPRPAKNYMRIVMASNDIHMVSKQIGDRRYSILNVSDTTDYFSNQARATSWWQEFHQQRKAGMGEGVLHQLLNWKYDPKLISRPLISQIGDDQTTLSMHWIARWWLSSLRAASLVHLSPDMSNHLRFSKTEDTFPIFATREALRNSALEWCRVNHQRFDEVEFDLVRGKICGTNSITKTRRIRVSGKDLRGLVFPPIKELREAFESKINATIDWEDEEEGEVISEEEEEY